MSRRSALLLIGALACAAHVDASAQGADFGVQVVKRASLAYQALSSFQALFRQQFEDRMMTVPDSRGTLYQEGKNKFAMRFSDPPSDMIIADGTSLCVYTPSETPGQVTTYPQQNHPTYGSNLLGTFLDNAADRYRITYLKTEVIDNHTTDAVIMEPLANDMPFRRATVWFDRENSMPRRLDIEEMRDHRRILQLTQLQLNASISPSIFVCKTPPGTKTIKG